MRLTTTLIFVGLFNFCYSQISDSTSFWVNAPVYNKSRTIGVVSSEIVAYSSTMIGLNELWYKDFPRTSFHLFDDNKEWLQMDKLGHATTSYYVGRVGYDVLKWSGVNEKKAVWIGGSLGLMFLTSVEFLDAFSSEWGFSLGDAGFNSIGTGMFIAQQLLWEEQRLLLKFSAHTTEFAAYRPNLLGSQPVERLLKDYNGQTYWLSVNISSFLKNDTKIPKWLNLAIGYSATGMLGGEENPAATKTGELLPEFSRNRQFYISLDADLTKLTPKSKVLKAVFETFGFIKIPFPALEFEQQKLSFKPFYF